MDDVAKHARLRYRARTDLYWLATEVLGYDDLVTRVHQPVCDHFYKMKPGTPIAQLSTEKGMCLYDPRAHFKTTLMIASAIQWMLNYPNIRLFIGAGKLDRATDSVGVIKQHFQTNAKLRRLFPECCPPTGLDWGTQEECILPNRTRVLVDPSLKAFSLDSIKAGPHCDVMFIDDAVHQDNIGTIDQLQNTITRFKYVRPIVEPYGYTHVIGTPYSDADLYAWLEDNAPGMRKFRRPAWTVTNPKWVEGTPLTADDVQLLFPERFTFDYLNEIRIQDPFIFNCQYLLDPSPRDQATFTADLLTRHTIPHMHIPKQGSVFTTWDIGFTDKKFSDFSVGATGLYDSKGNLFILDIEFGKWGPYELVNRIAEQALKWRPRRIGIEEAGGARLMSPALDNIQRQLGRNFNIEWIAVSPFKKKAERIGSLQPLFQQDKLYLSAAIKPEKMAEVVRQFTKFPRYSHDDIPDAVSMLVPYRSKVDIMPDNWADDLAADDDTQTQAVYFDANEDNLLGAGFCG